MAPVKLRDVVRLLIAMVLTAILFGFWLTTPVLEHLSRNHGYSFGRRGEHRNGG